jgi:hypothetical protein
MDAMSNEVSDPALAFTLPRDAETRPLLQL